MLSAQGQKKVRQEYDTIGSNEKESETTCNGVENGTSLAHFGASALAMMAYLVLSL